MLWQALNQVGVPDPFTRQLGIQHLAVVKMAALFLARKVPSSARGFHGARLFSNQLYIAGNPKIAGRANLPGSEGGLPKFLPPPGENFPYRFDVDDPKHGFDTAKQADIANWGKAFGSALISLVEKYGAVLVQGMPISGSAGFSRLMNGLGHELMPYLGGIGKRKHVAKGVDTASEEPGDFNIEPHNEMSDNTEHPTMVRRLPFQ